LFPSLIDLLLAHKQDGLGKPRMTRQMGDVHRDAESTQCLCNKLPFSLIIIARLYWLHWPGQGDDDGEAAPKSETCSMQPACTAMNVWRSLNAVHLGLVPPPPFSSPRHQVQKLTLVFVIISLAISCARPSATCPHWLYH
jgi:hypothetical protein